MEIAEFLLARVAEDEVMARTASGGEWDRLRDGEPKFRKVVAWGLTPIGAMNAEQDAEHIARWDPARVLAECEAKRRIVELHTPDHECTDGSSSYPGVFGAVDGLPLCPTLRALAMPYADHPDYDPAWSVDVAAFDH